MCYSFLPRSIFIELMLIPWFFPETTRFLVVSVLVNCMERFFTFINSLLMDIIRVASQNIYSTLHLFIRAFEFRSTTNMSSTMKTFYLNVCLFHSRDNISRLFYIISKRSKLRRQLVLYKGSRFIYSKYRAFLALALHLSMLLSNQFTADVPVNL